jgi:cell surface protein SprA
VDLSKNYRKEARLERSKADDRGWGVQSYFELGKFFKEESGVKIPMYYDYSVQKSRPEYNPLSPDILLQTKLDLAKTQEERNQLLRASETYVSRTSLNFTNVQKIRKGSSRSHFYSIDNFILTYAYSNAYKRDVYTDHDLKKTHKFVLNYNFNVKEFNWAPFQKIIRSKYLKLISDMNIGLLPQSLAFKTEIDRRYSEVLYRNTSDVQSLLSPIYDKNFTFKRIYDYKHNLTKSLRFSYDANVDAYIQEPYGPITKASKDSLWNNVLKFGRTKYFNQKVSLTYDVPLRKFFLTDWTSLQATYAGNYNWEEAPPTLAGDSIGNMIQNSQNIQFNGQLNFVSLYSKINFLKTINQGKSNVPRIKKNKLKKLKEEEKKKGNKDYNKFTEEDVRMNEGIITTAETFLRVLMALRSVNINYSINNGTTLPGFMKTPKYVGNDWNANAPGLPFILGWQDTSFYMKAAQKGWLTTDTSLNTLFTRAHTENLILQATLEPIKGLRINIDANRRLSSNSQRLFKMGSDGNYHSYSPIENGSFSMSFFSIRTSLKGKWDEKFSQTYKDFENNRYVISQRLSKTNIDDTITHYKKGYSGTSQQVIIPAFLAAYAGKNASSYSLDMFPALPGINWRITYSGLGDLDIFKSFLRSINFNHAYQSTYTVGSFSSALEFDPNQSLEDLEKNLPMGQNITPKYRVQQISITEQFAPLIGVDINWAKNWTSTIEYRTQRSVSFSFSNFQTSEIQGRDFTIGIGYRAKEVQMPFKIRRKKMILEHDLTFRFDISIKNNRSVIYKLDEEKTESVGGSKITSIKPTIEYVLSKNLKARLFFTRNVTKPVISTSYPTAFTNVGFSIIYTLGQ